MAEQLKIETPPHTSLHERFAHGGRVLVYMYQQAIDEDISDIGALVEDPPTLPIDLLPDDHFMATVATGTRQLEDNLFLLPDQPRVGEGSSDCGHPDYFSLAPYVDTANRRFETFRAPRWVVRQYAAVLLPPDAPLPSVLHSDRKQVLRRPRIQQLELIY